MKSSRQISFISTLAVCAAALALAPTLATAAGADGPATALLVGAGLCSRGASPGCCGVMESVVGDPNSPLMRYVPQFWLYSHRSDGAPRARSICPFCLLLLRQGSNTIDPMGCCSD
jgi:hypothetical protein